MGERMMAQQTLEDLVRNMSDEDIIIIFGRLARLAGDDAYRERAKRHMIKITKKVGDIEGRVNKAFDMVLKVIVEEMDRRAKVETGH